MNGRTINNRVRQHPHCKAGKVAHQESMVMAIHTALSVKVVGHLVEVKRDTASSRVWIEVSVLPGHVTTGLEGPALKVAADLLAERARRFFGERWTVADWQPPYREQHRGVG